MTASPIPNPLLDFYIQQQQESFARYQSRSLAARNNAYSRMITEDWISLDWEMWEGRPREHRHEAVTKYSWAVPTPEALEAIVTICTGRGIVEIGAGTGYWAGQLAARGVDVVAYDMAPPDQTLNFYHGPSSLRRLSHLDPAIGPAFWEPAEIFHPVEEGGPEYAGKYPDRVLLLCWPPYSTTMAYDALKVYQEAGGSTLVFIGEGPSGCTGDDEFHDMLDYGYYWDEWDEGEEEKAAVKVWKVSKEIEIPQWGGIHDRVFIFERA